MHVGHIVDWNIPKVTLEQMAIQELVKIRLMDVIFYIGDAMYGPLTFNFGGGEITKKIKRK
jgi:hypothetical protein